MNLEKLGAINDMEKAKEEEKDETDQVSANNIVSITALLFPGKLTDIEQVKAI